MKESLRSVPLLREELVDYKRGHQTTGGTGDREEREKTDRASQQGALDLSGRIALRLVVPFTTAAVHGHLPGPLVVVGGTGEERSRSRAGRRQQPDRCRALGRL